MNGFAFGFLMLLVELALPFSRGPLEGVKNLFRMVERRESWALLLIDENFVSLNDHWIRLPNRRSQLVMHTLGNYKAPNPYDTAKASIRRSAALFEVDIYMDSVGVLGVIMVLALRLLIEMATVL